MSMTNYGEGKMKIKNGDVMKRTAEAINSVNKKSSFIANYMGCSRQTLYNYMNEVSVINAEHLKKLCDLSGYTANYILFGREDDK